MDPFDKAYDLSGKTALITGSRKGIGFAIARTLAQARANVIINGTADPEAAQSAVNELQDCLLYTSPSPRDGLLSRMPSSA